MGAATATASGVVEAWGVGATVEVAAVKARKVAPQAEDPEALVEAVAGWEVPQAAEGTLVEVPQAESSWETHLDR